MGRKYNTAIDGNNPQTWERGKMTKCCCGHIRRPTVCDRIAAIGYGFMAAGMAIEVAEHEKAMYRLKAANEREQLRRDQEWQNRKDSH